MLSKISTFVYAFIFMQFMAHAQYSKIFEFDYSITGAYPIHTTFITDGTWLFGVASNGGANNDGVVFKIKPDGTGYAIIHEFNADVSGGAPKGSLYLLDDYLYGTTWANCDLGRGTLFRVKPDGSEFSTIDGFDGDTTGQFPIGSLYYDGTYFYGMTTQGGENLGGTVYRFLPAATSAIEAIFHFDLTVGFDPYSTFVSDGNYLYATTSEGGASNVGVVFKINFDGTGYTKLHEFTGTSPDGALPYGSLWYDGSEYLYGMSAAGGLNIAGMIYKVKTDGSGFETVYDFDGNTGKSPYGNLILQGTTFYGLTTGSGPDIKGNMFSVEMDGSDYNQLVDFDGDNGSLPFGSLLYFDGAFFGMTAEGGINNDGVIFRYGDLTEGINEIKASALEIYPNPAENYVTISCPQSIDQRMKIEFRNSVGEIVYTQKLNSGDQEINISFLPAGIYIVRSESGENLYSNVLIVQH
ncbi:MAG: choice-of-anchor tandem repeat GloVer-containing protein [Chitinophagales bacterium]